jgi:hypothetical protein
MPCYHPIPAHQDQPGTDVRLWPPVGTATMQLPCGNCLGCKTARATDWARRAEHEASMWEHNCFATLTYDDKHLPKEAHLEPLELTLFIKRLRQAARRAHPAIAHRSGSSLRYLAAGEYGEHTARPHYHLLLFNCGFNDKYQVAKGLYESPALATLWTLGGHRLGELTGASANYVAQYTLKKQGAADCDANGVVRPAPFNRMSLKPAIGTKWIEKNKTDLTHGYIVTNGTKGRIPRTYKNILRKIDPQLADRADQFSAKQPRRRDNLDAAEHIHRRRKELAESRHL